MSWVWFPGMPLELETKNKLLFFFTIEGWGLGQCWVDDLFTKLAMPLGLATKNKLLFSFNHRGVGIELWTFGIKVYYAVHWANGISFKSHENLAKYTKKKKLGPLRPKCHEFDSRARQCWVDNQSVIYSLFIHLKTLNTIGRQVPNVLVFVKGQFFIMQLFLKFRLDRLKSWCKACLRIIC